MRKIIHVDMDAFFAAVEELDNPDFKGKPLIVGGSPDSRSVVSTCNYIARKFGVHSAMPSSKAKRLCPQGIFVYPRMERYLELSQKVFSIIHRYSNLIEPLSIDEAYIDVSNTWKEFGSATTLAKDLQSNIYKETGLTCSAGVSYNKFLAKVASDWRKPNGLTVINPKEAQNFIFKLPIGKFYGIGKKTEQRMQCMGISNGKDLYDLPLYQLEASFGRAGPYYYDIVRGKDHREVSPSYTRKSLGKEITFHKDVYLKDKLIEDLTPLIENLLEKLSLKELTPDKCTFKYRYSSFETKSKVINTFVYPATKEWICQWISQYIEKNVSLHRGIRLIGITFSNFKENQLISEANERQLMLEYK